MKKKAMVFKKYEKYKDSGIVEAQGKDTRAEYGAELTKDFGRGFEQSNLRRMRLFYLNYLI